MTGWLQDRNTMVKDHTGEKCLVRGGQEESNRTVLERNKGARNSAQGHNSMTLETLKSVLY